MLTLEYWDPWRPAMDLVREIKAFLEVGLEQFSKTASLHAWWLPRIRYLARRTPSAPGPAVRTDLSG